MAVCDRCGRVNDPGALFCQDCGEPLEKTEESQPQGVLVCPACGKQNPSSTRFCRMCGVRLVEWGEDSKVEKRARMVCPVCGKDTPKGFAFCQFCGSRILPDGEEGRREVKPTPPAGLPRPVTNPTEDNDSQEEKPIRKRRSSTTDRWPSTVSGEVVPEVPLKSDETRQLTSAETEALQELSCGTAEHDTSSETNETSIKKRASSPKVAKKSCAELVHVGKIEKQWTLDSFPFDIGKNQGKITCPQDSYLSLRHARILEDSQGYLLKDLDSVNGTYVRVRESVELFSGSVFCFGAQVLIFERLDSQSCGLEPAKEDGILVFGSPLEEVWGRLRVLTVAGICRGVHYLSTNRTVLGRRGTHLSFPQDPSIAPSHVVLERLQEGALLESLGPDLDTYVKIDRPHRLTSGDVFKIGQQIFRFEKEFG